MESRSPSDVSMATLSSTEENMDRFNLQIQLLENAKDELRVNLENERAMNAEFRHKIGYNFS